MSIKNNIALRNMKAKPVRAIVLLLITALLSFTILGGTLIVTSLRKGLGSLEARLGADIMVVPYEAATKSDLQNIVLQGNTGYFYMDNSRLEKVEQCEGIGQLSCQFFLASASSGCCSIPVQIIGFDPETDFTISPWIKKSYGGELNKLDIVVGSDLNAFVGDTLTFYGQECRVAAKLDKTGTSYDTTVFASEETIKSLIQASLDLNMNTFSSVDPEKSVSCILINADSEHTAEEVVNDINLHVKKVKAVQTKEMISGISDSLSGVSDIIGILIAAVWILGAAILMLAFTMSVNDRKKEFAVLRVIGASRKRLAGIVLQEAFWTGLIGGAAGVIICLAVLLPFNGLIEETLRLPFLLPGGGKTAVYIIAALCASVLIGAVTAAVSAFRISRLDTGVILRGDN